MAMRAVRALFLIFICLSCSYVLADVRVEAVGEIKTLYSWEVDRCEAEFIPDSPARAFRRYDGKTLLLATHRENWVLEGDTLLNVQPRCRSVLRSSAYANSGLGALWIEAVYTPDGKNVYALVSNDLTSVMLGQGCKKDGKPGRCWVNRILAARSLDGGTNFSLEPEAKRAVATAGDDFPEGREERYGVFTTSNIFRWRDHYFTFVWRGSAGRTKSGNCLLRNADPSKPHEWLGWDGRQFSIKSAEKGAILDCAIVAPKELVGEVRSVIFDKKSGMWIAAFSGRLNVDGKLTTGFYYSVSKNLVEWSTPRLAMAAPTKPREQQSDYFLMYPSMLDPNSKSRIYDTLDGDQPVMFFTKQHLLHGRGTMKRDLQFVQLRIVRSP